MILHSLKVEKFLYPKLISHSLEEVDIAIDEKSEAKSACPWEEKLEEEKESILNLCFFIVTCKSSIL